MHEKDPNVFLKVPSWSYYDGLKADPTMGFIDRQISGELKMAEILREYPHPNIAEYLGVKIGMTDEGYGDVRGLFFRRYKHTLEQRLQDKDLDFLDVNKFQEQIGAALKHIHSLGYIHGDVKPDNIMLDENDNAYLIDFDSMTKQGKSRSCTGKGGTPYWYDDDARGLMGPKQDFLALSRIENWIWEEWPEVTEASEAKAEAEKVQKVKEQQTMASNKGQKRKREEEKEDDIAIGAEAPRESKRCKINLLVKTPKEIVKARERKAKEGTRRTRRIFNMPQEIAKDDGMDVMAGWNGQSEEKPKPRKQNLRLIFRRPPPSAKPLAPVADSFSMLYRDLVMARNLEG